LPLDVGHVLTYFVAHEAHHRGQIVMVARQLKCRLSVSVTAGLWQWRTRLAWALAAFTAASVVPSCARLRPQVVSVPVAGTVLPADVYGQGREGVVLVAHGGYSTRASWAEEARGLANDGFRVLVIETRGAIAFRAGRETDCLYDAHCMAQDVVAAVRRLRLEDVRSVAVIGGSAGGGAAAQASIDAPGIVDRLILLAPMSIDTPERTTGSSLVIVARNDLGTGDRPRLTQIREQYDRMPDPKELLILGGSAHGQRIFATDQGKALRRAITLFLRAPEVP
jgi:dienelactone hydrolase